MKPIGMAVLLVTSLFTAALSAGVLPIPESVERYSIAIRNAEAASPAQNLESVFLLGEQAARDLMRTPSSESSTPMMLMESFDIATYKEVVNKMKGFVASRSETLFVEPDVNFWVALADSKGQSADRMFFHLLKQTYPHSVWPVYVQQRTDYSGCTDFGTKALSMAYVGWNSLHRQYPHAYSSRTKAELEQLSHELLSTCACGDKGSVITELEYFLQSAPNDEIAEKIKERLEKLRKDEPETHHGKLFPMRYNCMS
jgi:hypothetical protein